MESFSAPHGFCLLTFLCVVLIAATYFLPIGKVKIGGEGGGSGEAIAWARECCCCQGGLRITAMAR